MNRIQLQAKAFLERRRHRIEALSHTIGDHAINPARYARWLSMKYAHLLREAGIEIHARPESDFFRSEIERFEAWNLKEARDSGLYQQIQSMSDDELIAYHQQLYQDVINTYTKEGNADGTYD